MSVRVKGILFSVLLIVIALLLLPLVVSSVHDVQTDVQLDSFPGCIVADNATDAVLTEDLHRDDVNEVTLITANGTGAVPVANTYTAGTHTLNVTDLGADTPQDLTVTYNFTTNADFSGVNTFVGLIPLLVVVGLIIVAILNGLWALKRDE